MTRPPPGATCWTQIAAILPAQPAGEQSTLVLKSTPAATHFGVHTATPAERPPLSVFTACAIAMFHPFTLSCAWRSGARSAQAWCSWLRMANGPSRPSLFASPTAALNWGAPDPLKDQIDTTSSAALPAPRRLRLPRLRLLGLRTLPPSAGDILATSDNLAALAAVSHVSVSMPATSSILSSRGVERNVVA